jgi:hypothetical protein
VFEPANLGEYKRKSPPFSVGFREWLGTIEDVRTFYWENRDKLTWLALPDILKSKA